MKMAYTLTRRSSIHPALSNCTGRWFARETTQKSAHTVSHVSWRFNMERKVLTLEQMEAFIAKYGDTPEVSSNGHKPITWVREGFTLENFIQKHHIRYKSKDPYNGG